MSKVNGAGSSTSSPGHKKSLLSRRQPTYEKLISPVTPEKLGITKRLLFRRREKMKDKNLVVIYYEGVVGDTSYQQSSYNSLRVRWGAWSGLRRLYQWAQVALVLPFTAKRARVLATYLEKHQGCPVDAIYTLRHKHQGKTKNKWYRY
jgi:hypothetical protein